MQTSVALAKCSDYGQAGIESALDRIMSLLGGSGRFISPGQTVLIKPNLLSAAEPDRAVTTHPQVVRAVIRLVKQCGATPVVADSPATAVKLKDVWARTGFTELCLQESVPLINLEQAGARGYNIDGMRFSIARPVLEADVVINVPKLKTHSLTLLTNAVKNMYGVMPGYQKTMIHKHYPHPYRFGNFLSVLYSQVKPGLTICDAVVGMEGEGPAAGTPVELGFIAGSSDGVALDAVMCDLLGIDMNLVFYLLWLKRRGTGQSDLKRITVEGDSRESLSLPAFRLPNTAKTRLIPERLVAMIRPFVWVHPSFTERCSACGLCVKSCPVSALSMTKGERPKLEPGKCIECCCCHEICPVKAIEMKQSPLVRLFMRRRFPS